MKRMLRAGLGNSYPTPQHWPCVGRSFDLALHHVIVCYLCRSDLLGLDQSYASRLVVPDGWRDLAELVADHSRGDDGLHPIGSAHASLVGAARLARWANAIGWHVCLLLAPYRRSFASFGTYRVLTAYSPSDLRMASTRLAIGCE